ncbi:MAG: hypothetical protein NVS2B7_08590 [Herpetosiphon sp.]
MFLERGFAFTHEAVREWEARFTPPLEDHRRTKRKGQAGRSWHADETYVKVKGVWKYLYRALDRDGHLVDSLLSEKRDMEAAKRFFRQALEAGGQTPECVTTDGHDSYPRAIRETLGEEVLHRCNQYLNNRIEQDHRGGSPAETALVSNARGRACGGGLMLLDPQGAPPTISGRFSVSVEGWANACHRSLSNDRRSAPGGRH